VTLSHRLFDRPELNPKTGKHEVFSDDRCSPWYSHEYRGRSSKSPRCPIFIASIPPFVPNQLLSATSYVARLLAAVVIEQSEWRIQMQLPSNP
jgi:hypothetical protein